MMYRLRITDTAWEEMLDGKRWYENQEFGAGNRFENAVIRTFALILERPMMYPEYKDEADMRKAVVKDFPYLVLYRVVDAEVWVVAVFDGRQRGPKWRS